MPLAVQFVQAAVFTPDLAPPYDLFVAAFGTPPTQLQPAQLPLAGTVALAVVDNRNLVLQANPGRYDLFAASVESLAQDALPGPFMPLADPDGAIDFLTAAAARLVAARAVINRINLAIRYVEPVENGARASALFSRLTGVPLERVGTSDNVFQLNRAGSLDDIPGAVLNRTLKWQTELLVTVTLPNLTPAVTNMPMAVVRKDHHAVSLNVDVGVITQSGIISVDVAGRLFHHMREVAAGLVPADISGRD